MKKSDVAHNAKATGGITGKGFMPGQSGNPAGGARLPPEVREALRIDTMPRYERLKKLSVKAELDGDLKTAVTIELALLKKQIPDLSSVEVTGADGGPVQTERIDPKRLNAEELAQLRAMVAKSTA